ncbi:MAG: hypothetical protein NZT61_03400 [Deltaproteobacteria bacterium]|nr:hypothetical protein [Deltaproteobacteria bacterium]MCX7952118.1 hypothetical protein [Deltaproteobacteria bacterium]
MGQSEERYLVRKSNNFVFSAVVGPFLDIALRKLKRKLNWDVFLRKYFPEKNALKRYYYFDYHKEDYRGISYINKLESFGFELISKRLPPRSQEIVKELIAVEIGTDVGFFCASKEIAKLKVVCPFRELKYPLKLARDLGLKVVLVDFSELPPDLVSLSSELIIIPESDSIFI